MGQKCNPTLPIKFVEDLYEDFCVHPKINNSAGISDIPGTPCCCCLYIVIVFVIVIDRHNGRFN